MRPSFEKEEESFDDEETFLGQGFEPLTFKQRLQGQPKMLSHSCSEDHLRNKFISSFLPIASRVTLQLALWMVVLAKLLDVMWLHYYDKI